MSHQAKGVHLACRFLPAIGRQVPVGVTLLIGIQKLLVVAQELIANGGGLVVAGEVAHVGKNAAGKIDAAAPAVGLIIALIGHQPTALDNLPIQAKDIQRSVVAACSIYC